MASLVCQHGRFNLDFYDAHRSPKRKRVRIPVRTKRDAELVRRKLERDYALGRFCPWSDDPLSYDRVAERPERLGDAHRAFLVAKSHKAPRTRSDYEKIVCRFVSLAGPSVPVCRVSASDVERWLDSTNAGDVTRQTYVRTLKVFFRWARSEGLTDSVATDAVKLRRVPRKFPRFLSEEEVARIVCVVQTEARSAHWLADLVVFAVHTGLRRAELVALRWEAVDLARSVLTVANTETFTTKSGAERMVPVSATAWAVLDRRHVATGGSGYVFTCRTGPISPDYLSQAFKRYARLAGIEDCHLHHLRHTACSWLAMRGVPVEVIRRFAGHSTITVTERYMHVGESFYTDQITSALNTSPQQRREAR